MPVSTPSGLLAVVVAGAGLSLLWNLPVELFDFYPARLAAVSFEMVLLILVVALLPFARRGALGRMVRVSGALLTAMVVVLKLAELITRESLARPFTPLLDFKLAPSIIHLLTETLDPVLGWLAVVALFGLPVLVFLVALGLIGLVQSRLESAPVRRVTIALCLGFGTLFAARLVVAERFPGDQRVLAHASAIVAAQWNYGRRMLADVARFEQAAIEDPFRAVPPEQLLAGLGGADVILAFVESYGRSALELPRFAERLRPTLTDFEARLGAAGLVAASAYLTSPTVGGQSWLAHGTLESGLWLAHQVHYDLLIGSDRLTLTRAFRRAGYRTVAFKPAITRHWAEGATLGFDRIYAAADMGYAGRPFNWVTMPDQYTLAVLEREERGGDQPLFAELSLISSHAPWTPIAPVLEDWSEVGDGAVFSRWADLGDPPEVVWRDRERVRHQYGLAVDYVIATLGSYVARFAGRDTLMIVVGDHQPAPLVTGDNASRDVPIHVITADPELLGPLLEWGFTEGMLPRGPAVARMDAFRDRFFNAFSTASDP